MFSWYLYLVRKGRASGEEGGEEKDEETLKLFLLPFDLSFFCCFPRSPTRLLSLSLHRKGFLSLWSLHETSSSRDHVMPGIPSSFFFPSLYL